MIKLIQNELKLRKISILKLGITALVINIIAIAVILMLKIDVFELIRLSVNDDHAALDKLMKSYGLLTIIMFPLVFVYSGLLLLTPFINIISALKRDIFGKERFLIFSLPVKNAEKIGSRIIVACIDFASAMLLATVFFVGILSALFKGAILGVVLHFFMSNYVFFLLVFIVKVFHFSLFVLTIYTIMAAISFITGIIGKRFRAIGIIVGIVLANISMNTWGDITEALRKLMPAFQLNADTSALQSYFIAFNEQYLHLPNVDQCVANFGFSVNFAVISAEIVLFVILFQGLSYFIDNKFEI